jgi:hypothetical protein
MQCAAGLGARGCERPQPVGDESLLMAALAPAALALATGAQLRLRRCRGAGEAGLAAVERGWRLSHVREATSLGRAGKVPKRTTLRGKRDEFGAHQRLVGPGAERSSSVISITSPRPGATPERPDARRPASSPGFHELYGVPVGPDQPPLELDKSESAYRSGAVERYGRRTSVSSGSCPASPFARSICLTAERQFRVAASALNRLRRAQNRRVATSRSLARGAARAGKKGDERQMARPSCPEKCGPTRRGAARCGRERRDSNPRPPA